MATAKKPAKPKVAKSTLPQGAQTVYTQAIADAICAQLSDGLSLNEICKQSGMPRESTVRGWVMDDRNSFAANYARARELGYSMLAEQIMEIADTPVIGTKTVSKATGTETTEGDMIEHRRLQVEARKWILAKMLPKVYGDKITAEHTGNVGFDKAPVEELTTALNDLLSKLK